MDQFDVLVIGGGHAGSEAALAAARMGARTALVTMHRRTIGAMSCNPAIGGLGKGQLVKEVDALFGEMGRAIDETGIQFRTLNSSKGPAVRSSRAQADRGLYQARIQKAAEEAEHLTIIEDLAGELLFEGDRCFGVVTESGTRLLSRAVVITTGTFLRGLMHTGGEQKEGGRVGERPSVRLSDSIRDLGLRMGRMKTGTPARIRRSSIDCERLEEQPGDTPIRPFSFRTGSISRQQISCWMTATSEKTHEIIRSNRSLSPMFNGQIQSTGPRYCPSIEDKVFRFADKLSHNIFLEPEGFTSDLVYPNGISTSLPRDVQQAFINSIIGLEQAEIVQFGYAVEYDHIDPTELTPALNSPKIQGLYFAGQINGTSGYEEAAAQGMMAGINAVRYLRAEEPFILRRDQGYIGVMIDDLTTLGVSEPYRMFTSRAEYRLQLREDNADSRLTPLAHKLGLVPEDEWRLFNERQDKIEREKERLEGNYAKPVPEINEWLASLNSAQIADGISLGSLLRRPELDYLSVCSMFPAEQVLSAAEAQRVETEVKFTGYLKRQEQDIARMKRMEGVKIPDNFSYDIKGLSVEVREKLKSVRPATLGQAGRVSGVTPAALSLVAIYLKRGSGGGADAAA
ncbi:MAG: tRNA uridine-5-carboxymethylaminomethyl(34) synthesis enzyme MnmG [bacterium]|nr:tRNA uridine-5-carboxymethylaminomethyl(34) synthesis enzyme MnmG [bacterium]